MQPPKTFSPSPWPVLLKVICKVTARATRTSQDFLPTDGPIGMISLLCKYFTLCYEKTRATRTVSVICLLSLPVSAQSVIGERALTNWRKKPRKHTDEILMGEGGQNLG